MEHRNLPSSLLIFAAVAVCLLTRAAASFQPQLTRSINNKAVNFVLHPRTVLNATVIISTKEDREGSCAFACLKNDRCFSFNEAVSPDSNNKYECQLLDGDKYGSASGLKPSQEFNHFSIKVSTYYSDSVQCEGM